MVVFSNGWYITENLNIAWVWWFLIENQMILWGWVTRWVYHVKKSLDEWWKKLSGSDIWWRRFIQNLQILAKTNRHHDNKILLQITVLMYIHIKTSHGNIKNFLTRLFSYINNINDQVCIYILKPLMAVMKNSISCLTKEVKYHYHNRITVITR